MQLTPFTYSILIFLIRSNILSNIERNKENISKEFPEVCFNVLIFSSFVITSIFILSNNYLEHFRKVYKEKMINDICYCNIDVLRLLQTPLVRLCSHFYNSMTFIRPQDNQNLSTKFEIPKRNCSYI